MTEQEKTANGFGAAHDGEAPGSKSPLTEELLERLLASATPDAYLASSQTENRTLAQYVTQLATEKGTTRSQVIQASGLNATYCYQIFQGSRSPGRDHAIMLAFGLGCTLREAQRLLRLAGVSELWCRIRRDAIIIFAFEHGLSRVECDDELYRLGEKTLLPEG